MGSIGVDSINKMLWTGIAIKRFQHQPAETCAVMRDGSGFVIPAMAADPFSYIDSLTELLATYTQTEIKLYVRAHTTSLMIRWNAHTVPLAPDLSRVSATLRSTIEKCHDNMADFYPQGLDKNNIGSNTGLSRVIRRFYIEREMNSDKCRDYTLFTVDVNIYDRMLKVYLHEHHMNSITYEHTQICYDASDGGRLLRQNSSINLAPWHNFKHGIELIWKHFAHEIFAPLYHRICPQNKFAIKYQSPQEPTMYIMMIGKAYSFFKNTTRRGHCCLLRSP